MLCELYFLFWGLFCLGCGMKKFCELILYSSVFKTGILEEMICFVGYCLCLCW